ncbi:MAG: hypothetical protein ACI85Z_001522 [Rheinheimera aquimaris]|jgi:hypothetical protein
MDGQKGFGGFKDVVRCWAMLLARVYDVFSFDQRFDDDWAFDQTLI